MDSQAVLDIAAQRQAHQRGSRRIAVLNEKGKDGWLIANAIIVVSIDDGK